MTNRLKGKNKVKKWLGYGKKNYHATLDFKESCYDFHIWNKNMIQGYYTPFVHKHCSCKV